MDEHALHLAPLAEQRARVMLRHGAEVVDEYGWLRDKDDAAVIGYLEAENAYAAAVLKPTEPLQEVLYREMLGRIKETDLTVPIGLRGYEYYARTEAGLQYAVQCRRTRVAGAPEEVLVDLNALAVGKTFMALGSFAVSDDDHLLAYSTDDTGFRQYRLVVKNLSTGEHLPLVQDRVTSMAWCADNRTLYFVTEDAVTKRSDTLWRQAIDGPATLVLREDDEAFSLSVHRSRSREWLVLQSGSHTTSECRVLRATEAGDTEWQLVIPRVDDVEYDVDHHGDSFLIRINDTGRNFRLTRTPVSGPLFGVLEEMVPHRQSVMLEAIDAFAGHLVLSEREAGVPHLAVHRLANGEVHRVAFPEPAYEAYLHSNPEWNVTTVRIGYQSLVTPASVYRYDMDTGERVLLKQQEVVGGYDASRFVSERIEAVAPDGTHIPISLVRRADVPVDGTAPGLLVGYGSYGYPDPVSFSSGRLSLLERGMVVAIAHIRGGGELGKSWHDAGRMQHKMNTFTDFIACAEQLMASGHVARNRLAIEGGSAGGLLMGAVTNLRPDLFAAVVSHVPFVDVVNTMSDPTLPLTVGEYEEWGNPGIVEQHAWISAYDPYLNLKPGPYPPMMVRTSLNDSQVMYWEPAKYVARLRRLRTNDAPLLFLTNMGAGHGGASGRYDRLREVATDYAFVLTTLQVEQLKS